MVQEFYLHFKNLMKKMVAFSDFHHGQYKKSMMVIIKMTTREKLRKKNPYKCKDLLFLKLQQVFKEWANKITK